MRSRYEAVTGQTVRLVLTVSINGQLFDPISFGTVEILKSGSNVVITRFQKPNRLSTGVYYVDWAIPSNDPNDSNYQANFDGSGFYVDRWNNIKISSTTTTAKELDFFVFPKNYNASQLSEKAALRFNFELLSTTMTSGSKDFLIARASEVDNQLVSGFSVFPEANAQLRKDNNIIKNWSAVTHNP